MNFLNKIFSRKKEEVVDLLRLQHKDEWDVVIIGDNTCTSKDLVISRYIDNSQVEWETIPVSDNFKWRKARVKLHDKVLSVWDADLLTDENKADYQAIADKIRMTDAWIWLQPDNEPIFSYTIERFIENYINKPYNGDFYTRCMSVSIPGDPKFYRYTKAYEAINDPKTPEGLRNHLSAAIGAEYMGGAMFTSNFDCRFYDYIEEEGKVKQSLFRLLLSSSSND